MSQGTHPAAPCAALVVVVLQPAVADACSAVGNLMSATGTSFPAPTPEAECGPGARPETDIQGRVPASDYESGRADRGYRCNTEQVAHQGTRPAGSRCSATATPRATSARSTTRRCCSPRTCSSTPTEGLGVVVLDMNDPREAGEDRRTWRRRRWTARTSRVLLNEKRGLLAGVLGNAATNAGILDVYDVKTDCRHPKLLSSTPSARARPRERLRPGREDVLRLQRGRPDPRGDRRHRPDRCRGRSSSSSA